MKKNWEIFLVLGILLLGSALIVTASNFKRHDARNIYLSHDKTFQQAKEDNNYRGLEAVNNLVFGHNLSEVYVNVGGAVVTLYVALKDNLLVNAFPGTSPPEYGSIIFGETADNIQIGSKSLQEIINEGSTPGKGGFFTGCKIGNTYYTSGQSTPHRIKKYSCNCGKYGCSTCKKKISQKCLNNKVVDA